MSPKMAQRKGLSCLCLRTVLFKVMLRLCVRLNQGKLPLCRSRMIKYRPCHHVHSKTLLKITDIEREVRNEYRRSMIDAQKTTEEKNLQHRLRKQEGKKKASKRNVILSCVKCFSCHPHTISSGKFSYHYFADEKSETLRG